MTRSVAGQEAFIEAYLNLAYLQKPAAFSGWLKELFSNNAIALLEKGDRYK